MRPEKQNSACWPTERSLSLTVGIATVGRPDVVCSTLAMLKRQTRQPNRVVVSASDPGDVGLDLHVTLEAEIIVGPKGLTHQRNAILRLDDRSDIIVFFDDDFVPADDYLEQVERVFQDHPQVVMSTGQVLADGIIGPGLTFKQASEHLASFPAVPANNAIDRSAQRWPSGTSTAQNLGDLSGRSGPGEATSELTVVYNGYGCNMAVRMSVVRRANLAFDEQLPLYGWLEDVDFSRRLCPYGEIVLCRLTRGVHLGSKTGRQSGVRFGYSQIANPIYLMRKGSMHASRALWLIIRNVGMNSLRVLRPESYVDRLGRLMGNASAIADLFSGQLHPQRIFKL